MKKHILNGIFIGIFGGLMAMVGGFAAIYERNTEDRTVQIYELDALVVRTKLFKQPYLASILSTVRGAMTEDSLAELINYTAAYSKHAIKEHPHLKIKKSIQNHKKTQI